MGADEWNEEVWKWTDGKGGFISEIRNFSDNSAEFWVSWLIGRVSRMIFIPYWTFVIEMVGGD